jgi:methanesulfonate monooxygenase small subunit
MKFDREAVRELIFRSCLLLDEERFGEYLDLYADEMRYRVTAFSPELRKDMVWLDLGRTDLKNLFDMLPEHVKPDGTFTRHINVCAIEQAGEQALAVTSSLVVFYTDQQGNTRVLAVGRYNDNVDASSDTPRIRSREVRLETRALGAGSQIPL